MTQENEPTQTPEPELTAEEATAKAVSEFQALGHTALMPTANFREAPEATERTMTAMYQVPKEEQ